MKVRFHVLASGSSGNACLLEVGARCVLLDFGLPARTLALHMRRLGLSWERVHAVVLSHTHSDHWQAATLTQLVAHGLPLYCHADHAAALDSQAFAKLSAAGLIRFYEPSEPIRLHAQCDCVPIALSHDAEATCGFRFEGRSSDDDSWAIGYAADLGCWTPALARHFADVDLLGLEFNHDIPMQLASRRHPLLIRRVLGDSGHLSNEQAAALLTEVIRQSQPGRLRALVQLHLSRECNRPELARTAARQALARLGVDVALHTAVQGRAGPTIRVGERTAVVQPLLQFGMDS